MSPASQPTDSGQPRRLTVAGEAAYTEWDSVYRDHIVGIYQLIFRRVGNAPDAEDLAEEVMVRTLRPMRFPAPAGDVRAYLVRTARSVLAEHWRRHYAAPEMVPALARMAEGELVDPAASRTAVERAMRILSLLPERSRQILELRFLRGLSVRDAAEQMGVSEANAKVLQFRALRQAAELGRELTS
jgi:RNA polymerase sigma factor (sigma-70 family)